MKRFALVAVAAAAVAGLAFISTGDAEARRGHGGGGGRGHYGHAHHGHHHGHHHHRWHPRRIVIYRGHHGGGASYGSAAGPSRPPAASPCTCLRRTNLPNGAVMFQDICTNEMAMTEPTMPAGQGANQESNQGTNQAPNQGTNQGANQGPNRTRFQRGVARAVER